MVGADDEIWDRRTCQAVGRETFRGVNPPWNPNRKTVSLMASKGTLRSQGHSCESWVPVLWALSLAARAHVLGDAGPLPSAQAKLLLHRDSPPQTPGLRGEICILTCIGRDGWSQVQSRGVSTLPQPPTFRVNGTAGKIQTETHFPSRNPDTPFNEACLPIPA